MNSIRPASAPAPVSSVSKPKSRAQAAVELLMMVAIGMVVVSIVVFFSQQQLTASAGVLRVQVAQAAVSDLARAADAVYTEGAGARKRLFITLPEGTTSTSVGNKTITLRMRTPTGETDVNAKTAAEVYGSLPFQPGEYTAWVWISAEENRVRIGLQELQIDSLLSVSAYASNETQYFQRSTRVSNAGDSSLQVNMSLAWTHAAVAINFSNLSDASFTLAPSGTPGYYRDVWLNITIGTSALGIYSGRVDAAANNSEVANTQVVVSVYQPSVGLPSVAYIETETFNDTTYSAEKKIFELPDVVYIAGAGWTANSSVTLNLTDPSNAVVAGYPKDVAANASGNFNDAWNPAGEAVGTYTLRANDSVDSSLATFTVIKCS